MTRQLRNIIGPIFHAGVCVHHIYAIQYSSKKKDFSQVTDRRVLELEEFGPVYFTTWNIIIQTIYFLLAMLYDVLHICEKNKILQEKIMLYKGYIFTSLVFPFSLFVSAMFWSVYSIDRELVFPQVFDEHVPEWLNHSMHTNIVVFLVIEVYIVNQLLPTFKSAFIGLTVLTAIYQLFFLNTYFKSGRWIYGLFNVFNWPERIAFMCCNYLFTIIVMKIGIKIQNFKHSLVRPSLRQKKE